ncbi:hypothetical protein FLM10_19400 [Vibrio cholerae]|nr:hypothetical protein FLM10_19400 [Vibrio cholerae]
MKEGRNQGSIIPFLLEAAAVLATLVHPQSHSLPMLMGVMRAILGSHQRPADGCANLFQTNLSLTCRLPATPSCLGMGREYAH